MCNLGEAQLHLQNKGIEKNRTHCTASVQQSQEPEPLTEYKEYKNWQ